MPHPTYAPSFSQFSATPHVCFQCHTEACALNEEDPLRRVAVWRLPATEHLEVPAIEIGVRCLRENVGQTGGATVAQRDELLADLKALQEDADKLYREANEAQALAAAAVTPIVDTLVSAVKEELSKGVRLAAVAGANAARKDAKATGA